MRRYGWRTSQQVPCFCEYTSDLTFLQQASRSDVRRISELASKASPCKLVGVNSEDWRVWRRTGKTYEWGDKRIRFNLCPIGTSRSQMKPVGTGLLS